MNRDETLPIDEAQEAVQALRARHLMSMPFAAIAGVAVAIALLIALALVIAGTERAPSVRAPARAAVPGVEDSCHARSCVAPDQLIGAADARSLKHRLGAHVLLVDISSTGGPTALMPDVHAPFVESADASGMQFRIHFGDEVDDALRAARMTHDEPVIVMAPSVELSVLAALFLQERGYSDIRVIRD